MLLGALQKLGAFGGRRPVHSTPSKRRGPQGRATLPQSCPGRRFAEGHEGGESGGRGHSDVMTGFWVRGRAGCAVAGMVETLASTRRVGERKIREKEGGRRKEGTLPSHEGTIPRFCHLDQNTRVHTKAAPKQHPNGHLPWVLRTDPLLTRPARRHGGGMRLFGPSGGERSQGHRQVTDSQGTGAWLDGRSQEGGSRVDLGDKKGRPHASPSQPLPIAVADPLSRNVRRRLVQDENEPQDRRGDGCSAASMVDGRVAQ